MTKITILLLNYQRPQNIPVVLKSIRKQSIKSDVFLWNNGSHDFHQRDFDWYIESSENTGCYSRWFMASYAQTKFICSLDDDAYFTNNQALEKIVLELQRQRSVKTVVGVEGVILHKNKPYYDIQGNKGRHIKWPEKRQRVDIVKGRLLALQRKNLSRLPNIGAIREDDIAISGILANKKKKAHVLIGGMATCLRDIKRMQYNSNQFSSHHFASREAARRLYFSY